jgi:hypothetical protein
MKKFVIRGNRRQACVKLRQYKVLLDRSHQTAETLTPQLAEALALLVNTNLKTSRQKSYGPLHSRFLKPLDVVTARNVTEIC